MPHSYPTIEIVSNRGHRHVSLDNTGRTDVSGPLQHVFDDIAGQELAGATVTFPPGIYRIEAPLTVRVPSIRLEGHSHSAIDIHGLNLAGGTILHFGPQCGPACITFDYAGHGQAFPSGESPWPYQTARVELDALTFVGPNNTDVDTAHGYSRFRGDEPNFRGLRWHPRPGRYQDVEAEGQRAVVIPPPKPGQKPEQIRVTRCSFTDLYVGLDIAASDVSTITGNWFGQMVDGIRYHGPGQCTFIANNCFADLETAMSLAQPMMSSLHDNSFAYVSKCFEIGRMEHSSLRGNVLNNWAGSTGAAAHGGFCHIRGPARNITITGNSAFHDHDSRHRVRTMDAEPSGLSFIQFDECERLLFTNNVLHTQLTQTVVRLHDCRDCLVADNLISHAAGGNAVAQTGDSFGNVYRRLRPEDSDPFDSFTC
jgi:hypothetical protein